MGLNAWPDIKQKKLHTTTNHNNNNNNVINKNRWMLHKLLIWPHQLNSRQCVRAFSVLSFIHSSPIATNSYSQYHTIFRWLLILINKMWRICYAFEVRKKNIMFTVSWFFVIFHLVDVGCELNGISTNCNQDFTAFPDLAQRHYFIVFHIFFSLIISSNMKFTYDFAIFVVDSIECEIFCLLISCAFIAFIFAYIQFI